MNKQVSFLSLLVLLANVESAAAQITIEKARGQGIITIRQGETIVKLAPDAGANVFSIEVNGVEYLHQPPSLDRIAGVSCGVPVLYPTPNRVKDAAFTLDGKTVSFSANAGKNFIHGLVNRHRWEATDLESDGDSQSVTCAADFSTGTDLFGAFPYPHQLRLRITVKDGAIRWTYIVDNEAGTESVPFGFALHPYFLYQGTREQTYLTIPATHWMEAENKLPTGKLVPARDFEFPLGTPFSLNATDLDDVFWGVKPSQPTVIDYRSVKRRVMISASAEFTHLVVWTPDRPFFGVESQTCSTDAHNLHNRGNVEAAHLQFCEPGKTMSGWVEYILQ